MSRAGSEMAAAEKTEASCSAPPPAPTADDDLAGHRFRPSSAAGTSAMGQ
jgi:hypothetical protein